MAAIKTVNNDLVDIRQDLVDQKISKVKHKVFCIMILYMIFL
jgi:hypothetical protein